MKKFFSMMMIAAAVFAFAACEKTGEELGGGGKLATPELTETHTDTSITVTWGKVENADSYVVLITGGDGPQSTQQLTYTFDNLNAGEYTIRVVAKAEGYEDSDAAKIAVTVTGATSVDWFTQTVSLPEVENPAEGTYRCNTIDFFWKGTGVEDIKYNLFLADDLEGVSKDEIIKALQFVEDPNVITEVNGDGFSAAFSPVSGGVTYALCVEVTNNVGVKFFTRSDITTEVAVTTEEAKAWLGTWTATTAQTITIQPNADGSGIDTSFSDKNDTFTLKITENPNNPNQVDIDGLSVLGEGYPTVGIVEGNKLNVMSGIYLGMSNNLYIYWLSFIILDGDYSTAQVIDWEQPAYVLTMNEDGSVTGETYKDVAEYQDGTQVNYEVVSSEIYGLNDQGGISFFIEAWPAVYRAGAMQVTKADANVSAKPYSVKSPNLPVMPTNLTTAW